MSGNTKNQPLSDPAVRKGRLEEINAYDELPAILRKLVRECPYNLSTWTLRDALNRWNTASVAYLIKRDAYDKADEVMRRKLEGVADEY